MDFKTTYNNATTASLKKEDYFVKKPVLKHKALEKQNLTQHDRNILFKIENRDLHGSKYKRISEEPDKFHIGRLI